MNQMSKLAEPGTVALEARNLTIGYGSNPVVRELNLTVGVGEVVGLLGANGAGKSTTLRGLAGELRPISGEVLMFGERATGSLHSRANQGLGFVTEEKSVIFGLSVLDNLRLGRGDIGRALDLFPELVPLRKRTAGTLSGGEQQILTFARALSRSPKVLLADELSLGLAPRVVERLGQALRDAAADGIGVLLVEQQAHTALSLSDTAYVLRQGQVVLQGPSSELIDQIEQIEAGYLSE